MKRLFSAVCRFIPQRIAAVVAATTIVGIVALGVALADPLDPRPIPPGFMVAPNLTPRGTPFPRTGSPPPFQTPAIVPIPRYTPPRSLAELPPPGTPILRAGTPYPTPLPDFGLPGYLAPDQATLDAVTAQVRGQGPACPPTQQTYQSSLLKAVLCFPQGWTLLSTDASYEPLQKQRGHEFSLNLVKRDRTGRDLAYVSFWVDGLRAMELMGCPVKGTFLVGGVPGEVCQRAREGVQISHTVSNTMIRIPHATANFPVMLINVGIPYTTTDTKNPAVSLPEFREALSLVAATQLVK